MLLKARQLIFLLGLVWLGCSAPHDNPLDPESTRYHPPAELTARVRSMHVSRNFPTTDTYLLIAELYGADAETQDSAWVTYKNFLAQELGWDTSANIWVTNFAPTYFNNPNDPRLGSVIGQPFTFSAQEGAILRSLGPVYLFRVIESVPQLAAPMNNDTVGSQPTLVWPVFDGGYPFEYLVTVISESAGDTSWNSLLPSSVLSARVPVVLADGPYQWTISVIDEFSNSSRSKEGLFLVAAGHENGRGSGLTAGEMP